MQTIPLSLDAWEEQLANSWPNTTHSTLPMQLLRHLHTHDDRPVDVVDLLHHVHSDVGRLVDALRFLERDGLVVSGREGGGHQLFALSDGAGRLFHTLERTQRHPS